MKNVFTALFLSVLFLAGCQSDKSESIPSVKSITEDRLELNDGTSLELPNLEGGTSTIFLIRHAEAEAGTSSDPGLSAVGYQRATRIDTLFNNVALNGIMSTSFKRSRETAERLADSKKVAVFNYEATNLSPVIPFITEYEKGGKFLMIGHSNTIPLLAKELVDTTINNIPEEDFDDFFVISINEKGVGKFFHYKY